MKMTKKFIRKLYIPAIFPLFILFIFAQNQEVSAASAVAFDGSRGIYGYSYNFRTKRDAQNAALGSCEKRGGRSCRIIVSCANSGYGIIYLRRLPGQKIQAIGAACGYSSKARANEAAKRSCNRIGKGRCGGPKVGWIDSVGTNNSNTNRSTPNRRTYIKIPKINRTRRFTSTPVFSTFTTNIRQKIIPGRGYAVEANFRWRVTGGGSPLKVYIQVKSGITYKKWTNILSDQPSVDVGSWMVRGVPGEKFHFRAVARDSGGRVAYSRIISF